MPDFLLRKDSGELEVVSGTEPFTVTPAAGAGSYDVYRLDNAGAITLGSGDLTAPTLAGLSVQISDDQAVLNWSTDEGNGTAYWVCTTQVNVPSSAQVISGQDHTGAAAEANGTVGTTAAGAQNTLPIDGLTEGQSYTFHLLQQDTAGNISNTLSETAIIPGGDIIPPILRYLEVDLSGTTATLSLSSDEANGTLYWVVTTSAQAPSATDILNGQGVGGASVIAAGNQPVTVVDTQPAITVPSLSIGTSYHFYVLQQDAAGNNSDVETISFTPNDATAPILSNVSVGLSASTATLNWSTDEDNGTGYWVCTGSATPPSTAQIIAGQNENGAGAVASGMQAVSQSGAQAGQVVTGLSNGQTYFFHLLHRDASGNTSTISSTTGVTVSNASATINIVERSTEQVAPEGMMFDISLSGFDTPGPSGSTYDPQLHELYYYWDFGDPGTFSSPENLPDRHKNSNLAYGPLVSHTFHAPGNYAVSCLVVEPSSGKSAVANINVTVGDPDVLFSGANTVFVDTTGAGTGAPSGAEIRTSLFDAFLAVSGQVNTPKRIMLRRGQTFPFGGFDLQHVPTVHVVAGPGIEAKPIIASTGQITWSNRTDNGSPKDFTLHNIRGQGNFNSATAANLNSEHFVFYLQNPPQVALIDNCDFDGFRSSVIVEDSDGTGRNIAFVMNDCTSTNWHDYAVYAAFGRIAVVGSRLTARPDALSGISGDGRPLGPIRMPLPTHAIIHNNDLFTNAGWFVNVPDYYTTQPTLRWMTSPVAGAVLNMQANALEAGYSCIDFVSGPPSQGAEVNAIIEKNVMVGNHMTVTIGRFQYGGITLRNNLCILPNVQRVSEVFNQEAFFWPNNESGNSAASLAAPIQVYNNTLVNLMDTSNTVIGPYTSTARNLPVFTPTSGAFNASESNNIVHQPNLDAPNAPDAPLNIEPLWDARYLGYVDLDTPRVTATRTPVETPAIYRPAIGSDALGDALNGSVAYDDFFGDPRPTYPSRGAFEIT